jgi:translation initiation factor 2B subunit (eIF-2B alpha/beta/delta family)
VLTLPKPALASLRKLAEDHQSGSVTLALQACEILATCAPALRGDRQRTAAFTDSCLELARRVVSAQPSLAAVWNVSNRWLLAIERGESPAGTARRIARELRETQAAAARHAAALIPAGSVVATYSASSTVLAALRLARKHRRRFRVLCSESRPLFEGRSFAARLAAANIPVVLLTDSVLLSEISAKVSRPDLILVGCDAVEAGCFVNKTGTAALAALAHCSRVPFYVAADSCKLLPARAAQWFRIRKESPAEVWPAPAPGVLVRNSYFERIPLRLCSAIILETGLCSPGQVRGLLSQQPVAKRLRRVGPKPIDLPARSDV